MDDLQKLSYYIFLYLFVLNCGCLLLLFYSPVCLCRFIVITLKNIIRVVCVMLNCIVYDNDYLCLPYFCILGGNWPRLCTGPLYFSHKTNVSQIIHEILWCPLAKKCCLGEAYCQFSSQSAFGQPSKHYPK